MDTSRTRLLLGDAALMRLQNAHVLVVGAGGVGAYAAELLVRAGVGALTLVDGDCVQPSNVNRQLCALQSTIGKPKVEVLAQRFRDINPNLRLVTKMQFIESDDVAPLLDSSFDFVVDAIDSLVPKCALIAEALRRRVRIISSMGAGAKNDVSQIRFADLWQTSQCALSKAVRHRLKEMGIRSKLPVVFCAQQPNKKAVAPSDEPGKTTIVGTVSYMPAAFGCFLASYVINNLRSLQNSIIFKG